MNKKKITPLLFLLILLLSSSCGFKKKRINENLLKVIKNGIPLTSKEISYYLDSLTSRYNQINSLSALGKVSLISEKRKHTIKQVIILKKNDYIRLEALNIFGQPFMYFLSDYDSLKAYYPSDNVLFYGKANINNIKRLIGINFKINNMVKILTGNMPIEISKKATLTGLKRAGYVYLVFSRSDEDTILVLDENRAVIKDIVKYFGPKKILNVTYENYKEVDGYLFPFKLEIDMLDSKKMVNIRYKQIAINKKIKEKNKDIILPEGVKKYPIETMLLPEEAL